MSLTTTYSPSTRVAPNRLTSELRRAMLFAMTVLAVAFFAPLSRGQEIAADSQDAEVLTRGPIHDAFAMPVGLDPVPGIVVPRDPPADIEELPPEVAVEDDSAEWIAGYWNYDDERQDFIWISGVWRVAPPNHRWVPGYWTEVQGGFQRISGFWAPIEVRQVVYYPQPPQSLEAGPNSPQPSPNHFWVPGSWMFTDGRYVWRGGYWAASQEQWVWIPSYYLRTPGGYIYNAGYWDYPLDDRGIVFAPVYFRHNVYTRPNFYYSPSVLIRATVLLAHLFARPAYGNYYFGDYYGTGYADSGYYPWFAAGGGGRGNVRWYDPIYAYQRVHHHRDPDWSNQLRQQHDFYDANRDARPRRTYSEQRQFAQAPGRDRDDVRNTLLATSVTEVFNNTTNNVVNNNVTIKSISNVNIRRVQNDERKTIQTQARDVQQFAKQRSQIEKQARVAIADDNTPGRGPRADAAPGAKFGLGPQAGTGPQAGASVAATGATLTLPELPTGSRGGRGPNANSGPKSDRTPPSAVNPIAGGNRDPAGPGPRADREGRGSKPVRELPQRPDAVGVGPNSNLPNVSKPNVVGPNGANPTGLKPDDLKPSGPKPNGPKPNGPNANPNQIAPRTGPGMSTSPAGRSASSPPGSGDTEKPATPPGLRNNEGPRPGPFGNREPKETPNVPKLPQVPVAPGTGELPRAPRGQLPGVTPMPSPSVPTPRDANPQLNKPQPSNAQPSNTLPKISNQPRNLQPRNNPSRNDAPRGDANPQRSAGPQPGNGPGRGNRPESGVTVPGATGQLPMPKPEMRQRPQQNDRPPRMEQPRTEQPKTEQPKSERPQQRERPEPKKEAPPQQVPKVSVPVAPQTPPGTPPDEAGKPERKKKK